MKPTTPPILVRCMDCRHARLVQFATDPVIAYCPFSNYGEIAAKERRCSRYEKGAHTIDHHPKQTGWWHERETLNYEDR